MRLRFTIRDLLWLTLLLALAVGCWVEPSRVMPDSDNRIAPFRLLAALFCISAVLFTVSLIRE